jgi:signal peptidase
MTDMAARTHGRDRSTARARTARRVRGALSVVLLLIAAGALVLCGYQTASGRWHATPVLSGSMRPGLQPGDIVVTQRVPISDLHVRDVIVFHPPDEAGRQTVHRIVKLQVRNGTTVITTRGDANSVNDPAVTALKGTDAYRVARVIPLVGYPAVWLQGGRHGLLVTGLGILLLVGAAVVLLRPEPRKERRRDESDASDDHGAAPDSVSLPPTTEVPPTPEGAAPSSTEELFVLAGDRRRTPGPE